MAKNCWLILNAPSEMLENGTKYVTGMGRYIYQQILLIRLEPDLIIKNIIISSLTNALVENTNWMNAIENSKFFTPLNIESPQARILVNNSVFI